MKNLNHSLLFCLSVISAISFSSCEVQSQTALQRSENDSKKQCEEVIKTNCSDQQLAKNIFAIFEDNDGNLWFGMQDKGVAKYDGKSLTYISYDDGLCGGTVADMAQGNDGIIWFGTYSDMCLYDPKASMNNSVMNFSNFEKTGDVPHLGYGWKSVKTDPEGNIWVNTHQGIFSYVNGDFKEFTVPTEAQGKPSFCSSPGGVSFDLTDSKGNMWFGTDGDGAYKYDGTSFTHFSTKDGLNSNSVMGIVEDKNGDIWFACRETLRSGDNNGGLSKYDGTAFHNYPVNKGLYKNDLNTIYSDNSGNVWIGATGVGVYKYDGDGFTLYAEPVEMDTSDTFHIAGLQSILEDSNGTIWMGFSGGLFRLEDGTIKNVTKLCLSSKTKEDIKAG